MQALFQIDKVAALSQPHVLRDAGKLIQIGGKISDAPNSGVR
jgi:hypothetical protein